MHILTVDPLDIYAEIDRHDRQGALNLRADLQELIKRRARKDFTGAVIGLNGQYDSLESIAQTFKITRERVRQITSETCDQVKKMENLEAIKTLREFFAKRTAASLSEVQNLLADDLDGIDPYGLARIFRLKYNPELQAFHRFQEIEHDYGKGTLAQQKHTAIWLHERADLFREPALRMVGTTLLKVLCANPEGIRTKRFYERLQKVRLQTNGFYGQPAETVHEALTQAAKLFPFTERDGKWVPTEPLNPETIFPACEYKMFLALKDGPISCRKLYQLFPNLNFATFRGLLQNYPFTEVDQTIARLVTDGDSFQYLYEGAEIFTAKKWVYLPIQNSHVYIRRKKGLVTDFAPIAQALGREKFLVQATPCGIQIIDLTPEENAILKRLRMSITPFKPSPKPATDLDADAFATYAKQFRVPPGTLVRVFGCPHWLLIQTDNGHYAPPEKRFISKDGKNIQVAQVLQARIFGQHRQIERMTEDEIVYLDLAHEAGLPLMPPQHAEGDTTEIFANLTVREAHRAITRRLEKLRELSAAINAHNITRNIAAIRVLEHEGKRLRRLNTYLTKGSGSDPVTNVPPLSKRGTVIPIYLPPHQSLEAPAKPVVFNLTLAQANAQAIANVAERLAELAVKNPVELRLKEPISTPAADPEVKAFIRGSTHKQAAQIARYGLTLNHIAQKHGIGAFITKAVCAQKHLACSFSFRKSPAHDPLKNLRAFLA